MNIYPKYSVLMSLYIKENPEYFKKSIESMLDQSYKPDEIVIVIDGQITENLRKIIHYYVKTYKGLFTIVQLDKNLGLGLALNEGIKHCKNTLIARMDTDDISLVNRCELQIAEFVKNPDLAIIGSNVDEFGNEESNVTMSRIVPSTHDDIKKYSRRKNPFNHPTVMYNKDMVMSLGGYQNYRRNQDFDLFGRMLISGMISMNLNKSLLLFRANSENLRRRKSWKKCSSYILIIYQFWKAKHSTVFDLIVVTITQMIAFIVPAFIFKWLTKTFLRKETRVHNE